LRQRNANYAQLKTAQTTAVMTKEWRRATGGKYDGKQVWVTGEAVRAVTETINTLYREIGVERKVEVKYDKNGTPYITLTNIDLGLLGVA